MFFRWKQFRSNRGEMERWGLVHVESGRILLEISLSQHTDTYSNWKVRRKIQRAYELYYGRVFFETMKFF